MDYNFILVVKEYERNSSLDFMRKIYNHKTCLVAKNHKFGNIYIHPAGKIIKGSFHKVAGSHSSPELIAKGEVHIQFTNFPHNPNKILTDQHRKQNIIKVLCLEEYSPERDGA